MVRSRIMLCLCFVSVVHRSHQIDEPTTEEDRDSQLSNETSAVSSEDVLFGDSTPIYTVSSNSSFPHGLKYELISGLPLKESWTKNEDPINEEPINRTTHFESPSQFNIIPPPGSNIQKLGSLSDTIYPEILLIVDYDSYKSLNCTLREAVRYYVAFMPGVDVKFSQLQNPKVRLNIAGIIIALDINATPYLNNHRDSNNIIYGHMLAELESYLYSEERFPRSSYDEVLVITTSLLCLHYRNYAESTKCKEALVKGLSKLAVACSSNTTEQIVESVAVVHDKGFSGIAAAAHELGHAFGLDHDGSNDLNWPVMTNCTMEDGYIMGYRNTENKFKWSECSQDSFRYFFNLDQAQCLRNKPKNIGVPLPRLQPGELFSLDEQCFRSQGFTNYCPAYTSCLWVGCYTSPGYCETLYEPPEGTPCSDGKICKLGRCVNKS